MTRRISKIGLALAATATTIPLFASIAAADPAPTAGDVVGVGSDTVQYAADFVADGDFLGDPGFNTAPGAPPLNRMADIDATADVNARLAYSSAGVGSGTCAPGTGGTQGTGKQTTSHTDQPCTLNPTIVLRAGLQPVQRPNGSGAGGTAGFNDYTTHTIDFIRASADVAPTLDSGTSTGSTANGNWDAIIVGKDNLQVAAATTTDAPATGLSTAELNAIYSCTITTWNALPGNSTGSSATIIPIVPQVGSGTRSTFLKDIGNPTLGGCVKVAEENDPFAIAAQASPADAIEPLSGGRLNLYLGQQGSITPAGSSSPSTPSQSNGYGGYFLDPSCQVESTAANCTGVNATTGAPNDTLTPATKLLPGTGNATDGNAAYIDNRNLYIYFRNSDVNSTKPFEPGGSLNFVRTLFYNPPISGAANVTVNGVQYGPGGQPFFAQNAGLQDVASAGINAVYQTQVPAT